MNKYINFIGPYCVQSYTNGQGRINVHATVGSTRAKGGYNREMDLLNVYKEMVSQWKSYDLKVTKKYIRLSKALTFGTKSESRKAIKEFESKLIELNKQ